ncbi:uncharacterized protein LOC116117867 [Pistacia vera]|uniref:uncharacterized protein LOC116117867 n=1 Tax=Pistacia vera TaxID=55513 RepID=UPI001262D9BB|nr:uncharacterized protein LOC116117867 [Pistacia vera]
MEAISIASDPHLYFQVGKIKINEGMKCLRDLVEWYKVNLTSESAGGVHEIMAYLQFLQRQVVQVTLHTNVIWFVIINNWIFLSSQCVSYYRNQLVNFGKKYWVLWFWFSNSSTLLSNISIWVLRLS